MSTAVAEELYALQSEELRLKELGPRIADAKRRLRDEEEGRKAAVQLCEADLERVLPEYSRALNDALKAFRLYVQARELLVEVAKRRREALTKARKLEIEVDAEAVADDLWRRRQRDPKLDTFFRLRAQPALTCEWPR